MLRAAIPHILYTVALYLFLFVILGTAVYLLRKKKVLLQPLLLIVLAIIIDVLLFDRLMYSSVTLERKAIGFDERPTGYYFSEKRVLNLFSDSPVLYFRPALYKKAAALSSYTVNIGTEAGTAVVLDKDPVAQLYVTLQDYSAQYPLYEELNRLNIKQFVEYGMSNIDSWSIRGRLFFSRILRAVAQGFTYYEDFYEEPAAFENAVERLLEGIGDGTAYFYLRQKAWPSREIVEENIASLFDMARAPLFDHQSKDYVVLDKEERADDSNILIDPNFLNFLYNDITARDYLAFLFEKDHAPESIFVLLKDYYELVNSTNAYKQLRGQHNLISRNLLNAVGVTEPTIRYYRSARLASRDDILSSFEYGVDTREDTLCLEGDNGQTGNHVKQSVEKTTFSHHVLDYNPNVLSLEYEASEDGYLYFSDSYDTYWQASVDGKRTDIYKANVAFKAIKVPAGRHKVDFVYDPELFRVSLWFYYAAFGIGLLYLGVGAFGKVKAAWC